MKDPFRSQTPGLTSPATDAFAIEPSDEVALASATRALYVGGGGDATVQMLSGGVVTLRNLQGGTVYPIRITQVMLSETTATDLVGMS